MAQKGDAQLVLDRKVVAKQRMVENMMTRSVMFTRVTA
jgi:hypothetical protein